MRWLLLGFWIVVCLGVGAIGGRWTAPEIPAWYRGLRKPSFNPPNWLFGPVWISLYLLMAIAGWIASGSSASPLRAIGLSLFAVQLALNLLWSWIFFRRHEVGSALAENLLLWLTIGATMLVLAKIAPAAAWLMAPYFAWVSFAVILNAAIWRLNSPSRQGVKVQPYLP
jgi:translocator protein